MANKGSPMEREVAKRLSLWLSGGADDSWVWRTANSGGRATVRRRRGKATSGHVGDLCATDPRAGPFFELVTVELKRGYNRTGPHDLLDRTTKAKRSYGVDLFIQQARTAQAHSGTRFWMVVHRRDQREALCYAGPKVGQALLRADGRAKVSRLVGTTPDGRRLFVSVFPLADLLAVRPKSFLTLLRRM